MLSLGLIISHCWGTALLRSCPQCPMSEECFHSGWWEQVLSQVFVDARQCFLFNPFGWFFPKSWAVFFVHLCWSVLSQRLKGVTLQTSGVPSPSLYLHLLLWIQLPCFPWPLGSVSLLSVPWPEIFSKQQSEAIRGLTSFVSYPSGFIDLYCLMYCLFLLCFVFILVVSSEKTNLILFTHCWLEANILWSLAFHLIIYL